MKRNQFGMTPAGEIFAQEVVKGKSFTDAYKVAYPKAREKGRNPDSVNNAALRLRRRPDVVARIAQLSQKAEEKCVVEAGKLLREACRIAYSDVSKIMNDDGTVKMPHKLDEDTRAAVSSVKFDRMGGVEYKFWDKNSAQERLFRHKALYAAEYAQQAEVAAKLVTRIELVGVVPQPK